MSATRLSAYVALFSAVVIWGIAGPVIKFTLGDFPPTIFLTYRFAISSVIALMIWGTTRELTHFLHSKFVPVILFYAFLNSTVTLGLLFWGYAHTTSLVAAFLSAIAPIFTAIAGFLVFHDHITKKEKIGIIIACIGATIAALGPTDGTATVFGNILVLLSILAAVVTGILAKKALKEKITPLLLTNMSFVVGFLTMIPLVLYQHSIPEITRTLTTAPLIAHAGVWYMAILSGTVGYYLWNRGQRSVELSEAGLFNYLIPIVTIPLSLFWLHESVSTLFIVGTVITTLGVAIAELKKRSAHAAGRRSPGSVKRRVVRRKRR